MRFDRSMAAKVDWPRDRTQGEFHRRTRSEEEETLYIKNSMEEEEEDKALLMR